MSKFVTGDKALCLYPTGELTKGKTYEVLESILDKANGEYVRLKDIAEPYLVFRFERLDTDAPPAVAVVQSKDTLITGSSYKAGFGHDLVFVNETDKGLTHNIASKNDKNKVDLSLIPSIALFEEAKAFMVGEKKYNRYNYCKGHKASQLVAAAMRHLTAWFEREENDPIDGQHHLGSVRACCAMILRQQELGTMIDDRFEAEK